MELFLVFLVLIAILYGIRWMSEKWNGTTIVSHSEQGKKVNEYWSDRYDAALRNNPKALQKAVYLCERKGHVRTKQNIMAQYEKVLNGDDKTIFEKAGKLYGTANSKIKEFTSDKSSITSKLSKIEKLKNEGIISDKEYSEMRRNILNNYN